MASRDALAVRRQKVIDSRAAAIAALQQQFTELQNQLLCELRRAVGAVEAAEHAAVRPLEAEMDGMVQRVQDIDRLAELTALKVRSEPKHKFVEYARLLQQARRHGPLVPIQFDALCADRKARSGCFRTWQRRRRCQCRTPPSMRRKRRCGCLSRQSSRWCSATRARAHDL